MAALRGSTGSLATRSVNMTGPRRFRLVWLFQPSHPCEMQSHPTVRTRGAAQLRNKAVGGASASIEGVVVPDKERTMSKKSIFLTQVIMTFIMAATMSGIMGLIVTGPSMQWLAGWPRQFIIAWPIAFAVTMVAWPASMALSSAILKSRKGRSTAEKA